MNLLTSTPLVSGFTFTASMQVEEIHTVPALPFDWPGFEDMPPVFATAVMVGFAEQTCIEGLRKHPGGPFETVGIHINMSHKSPTLIGDIVEAHVELTERNRNKLTFEILLKDSHGDIGTGRHERYIIDPKAFMISAVARGKS